MTIFWRQRFLEALFIIFCLKIIAILLQICGFTIIATQAFGNMEFAQSWSIALNILPTNIHFLFLDITTSIITLLICYIWLNKLILAKKKRFRRFPGNTALFTIFIIFLTLSSHWILSVFFFILFILAKKKQQSATDKLQSISYS